MLLGRTQRVPTGDGGNFHPPYFVVLLVFRSQTLSLACFCPRTLAEHQRTSMEEETPNAIDNELRELRFR